MKFSGISPAGVLALMAVLGMLPPTSALPKEPQKSQISAGSSTILVSKIIQAVPTGTQAMSAVTAATQPGAAFWLRAVPKKHEHVTRLFGGDPGALGERSLTCVGAGCMDYNGACTDRRLRTLQGLTVSNRAK